MIYGIHKWVTCCARGDFAFLQSLGRCWCCNPSFSTALQKQGAWHLSITDYLLKGVKKPFALTYQWISKRFSSLWVRSIVELGWTRHHGELHRRTVVIHHPKEFLNQPGELRMGIQLLLERHGNALKGDIVVGGADAPRSDKVCVLRWQKGHFFGDDLLHIGYNGYALHWHPELPQRSCQKAAVGVHCVTLTDDNGKRMISRSGWMKFQRVTLKRRGCDAALKWTKNFMFKL